MDTCLIHMSAFTSETNALTKPLTRQQRYSCTFSFIPLVLWACLLLLSSSLKWSVHITLIAENSQSLHLKCLQIHTSVAKFPSVAFLLHQISWFQVTIKLKYSTQILRRGSSFFLPPHENGFSCCELVLGTSLITLHALGCAVKVDVDLFPGLNYVEMSRLHIGGIRKRFPLSQGSLQSCICF